MKELAKRLKYARENKGVTQMQVYKDTGIHNKTLSGYERGISEPDLNTLKLLANYYDTSVDYLLGSTDQYSPGKSQLPSHFSTPEEAIEFILKQPAIMGFGGFDIEKMSDKEVLEFANELLRQLQLISYKYKK